MFQNPFKYIVEDLPFIDFISLTFNCEDVADFIYLVS